MAQLSNRCGFVGRPLYFGWRARTSLTQLLPNRAVCGTAVEFQMARKLRLKVCGQVANCHWSYCKQHAARTLSVVVQTCTRYRRLRFKKGWSTSLTVGHLAPL